MDTVKIGCTHRDIPTFRGVYPSDLLPRSTRETGTVIINADPHEGEGSHWLEINFYHPLSSAFYFDSYGLAPSEPNIFAFLKRNCAVWTHNTESLQGPLSVVCGHYIYGHRIYYTTLSFFHFWRMQIA